MTPSPIPQQASDAPGFHGEILGLSLADVIQLNGHNRFSGCITVHDGARTGLVFFRDGAVVHAEQGRRSGEDAFYDIMEWSSGTFRLDRNVATTVHTIHKNVEHLLIEACRVLDERRAGRGPAVPAAQAQPSVVERLGAVPGVAHALFMGRDGARVDDTTSQGEALAGRAAFVAMIGSQLGALLGLGPLRSAAVHGGARREHLLLLGARTHYLTLLLRDVDVGAAEAQVRRVLGAAQ